jgi:DNA adenine methylase
MRQQELFADHQTRVVRPFKSQLLKWVGNKQRFAHEIASHFPSEYRTYREPFLGSGGVLGTLKPHSGIGSDVFPPLVEIWRTLKSNPEMLIQWYVERWQRMNQCGKAEAYELIKASYNASPNGADLLFLSRSCYGGVVRFRQSDGYMSTPCGAHAPIPPEAFTRRVQEWHSRVAHTDFYLADFEEALDDAAEGDIVYCDPPYTHSQSILYGAQAFSLQRLLSAIGRCKDRGVFVALSIDGTKRSGDLRCELAIPTGLFERELLVNCGRSMLRRFQLSGKSLEQEVVADRLLMTT